MKVFLMDMKDDEGVGLNILIRAQESGHIVKYWSAKPYIGGKGLVPKVTEWKPQMDWADLIILTGNCDYPPGLDGYFGRGYPIFGTNPKAAQLELDRGKGQEILKRYGVEVPPYIVVDSTRKAIQHIAKTGKAYAIKPWGGEADKAMTCVSSDPDEAIFTLSKWGNFDGQLMMQEMVEGVEIGISGWFGPHGWSAALEESFEHKKFMNDDLGGNTGEMGTVIRHTKKSKLFDKVLEPITDYLHQVNYVGDASVNCIVDRRGTPFPLEWTMRLGWPDFNIRQSLIKGDPVEWMRDLVEGKDSIEVSTNVAVGVVLAHGDFPHENIPKSEWAGFPIKGIDETTRESLHLQQVQYGKYPALDGKTVVEKEGFLTAGTYVMVVTGTGKTVEAARKKAYDVAWQIKWPSNIMFRTDIGCRLEEELPKLHKHGYAEGLEYGT